MLEREPTCNTTHHAGCDCQVQRHVREKVELLSLLAFSTEREERYRKALEYVKRWCDTPDMPLSALYGIARKALSPSPAPEPVTVEELAELIWKILHRWAEVDDLSPRENFLAAHLLTKYKIERKR